MHQLAEATYAAQAISARATALNPRSSLQARLDSSPRQARQLQKAATIQRQALQGTSRLPNKLKAAIEKMSGLSLDGVRVHYNSSKPAQVQASAYAQGNDIYLAPGQERHLPHETWHIVQQKQGRVRPTVQINGVAVNDDHSLEREADLMGMRANS